MRDKTMGIQPCPAFWICVHHTQASHSKERGGVDAGDDEEARCFSLGVRPIRAHPTFFDVLESATCIKNCCCICNKQQIGCV